MSELRSIHLAIELATRQRDELVQAKARAAQNMRGAQNQMLQLQSYANDTDARWIGSAAVARSAALVGHHYQFMDRLQQAIGMQQGFLENMEQQLEVARQALLQAEIRLSGLNQILKSRQAALLLKQRKREQQQTDEFAALLHARGKRRNTQGDTHEH